MYMLLAGFALFDWRVGVAFSGAARLEELRRAEAGVDLFDLADLRAITAVLVVCGRRCCVRDNGRSFRRSYDMDDVSTSKARSRSRPGPRAYALAHLTSTPIFALL